MRAGLTGDTTLVSLAIRWMGHAHKALRDMAQERGVPFVMHPGSLSPSSVAWQVSGQLERRHWAKPGRTFKHFGTPMTHMRPALPPGYYLHGSDMGHSYRRVPNVGWPVEVHYELNWSAKIGLDVELGRGRPERQRLVALWPSLVQEVQAHFPEVELQGNSPSEDRLYVNLKLAFPAETPVPEIAEALTRLIALTEARVTEALASPVSVTA